MSETRPVVGLSKLAHRELRLNDATYHAAIAERDLAEARADKLERELAEARALLVRWCHAEGGAAQERLFEETDAVLEGEKR